MRTLQTAREIIEELGGPTAVGRIVGRSVQSIVNWRAKNRLPPDTFLLLSAALQEKQISAPPSLWGIKEP